MRADQLLVTRQLASTRSQAQRLIASGMQWRRGEIWETVHKNGDNIPATALVRLLDDAEARYVSRGGLKLEAALKQVGLNVSGLRCLDVGQSTGGFTDCLLQAGAAQVTGVDVGSAQLHPQLRADARVVCLEKTNARALRAQDFLPTPPMPAPHDRPPPLGAQAQHPAHRNSPAEAAFDVIVVDLSFISQTLVLPAIIPLLKTGGTLLSLVKPQFELQPHQLSKGGIVKNPAFYALVETRLRTACAALSLQVRAWFDSPIAGGDGNHEFFICADKSPVF